MNETMSTPSSNWPRYYQQILSVSTQGLAGSNELPNTVMGPATTINSSGCTTQEGHVSKSIPRCGTTQGSRICKPIRKRSGVSRKTPTTLLSTTTTNFKAMVQQFTGYPISPFAPVSTYLEGAHINMGLANSQPIANPNTVMVAKAGYNVAQREQQQQYRHQQYMPPVNSSGSVGGKNAFLQELQSSRGPVMLTSGGEFGMDNAFSPVPPSFNKDMSQFSYM